MTFLHTLFHSCRRVDELVSQSMDEPLGWLDRLRMGVHLRMCPPCREVQHQVDTLHEMGAELGNLNPSDEAKSQFSVPSQPPRR